MSKAKMVRLCSIFSRRPSFRLNPNLKESQEGMMNSENDNEKQSVDGEDTESGDVEWVAPEGGWGYVVLIGFSVMFIVVTGPISAFGMIFKDFFEDHGDGTSALTLVNGVHYVVVSFSGFLTSNALKHFSLRQVGVFGSLVYVSSTIMTVFTMNVPYLVVAGGILEGVGFGIMIPISMTSFNNYFVEKRVFYLGVTSVLVAGGVMLFPAAIKYFMETYGFRGTLLIISGISMHAILSMLVMQPAEWHYVQKIKKGIETPVHKFYNDITLSIDSEKDSVLKVINIDEKEAEVPSLHQEGNETKEPLLQSVVQKIQLKPSLSLISDIEKQGSINYTSYEDKKDKKPHISVRKASSLQSLGNWTVPVLASEAVPAKNGKWRILIDAFDLSLLKDPKYCIICFGVSFSFFSDITFFILQPTLLYHYGFTQTQVAYCITAGGAADLGFRVIMAIYTFKFSVNSRTIFYSGTVFMTILRLVFMQFTDFYNLLILTACLGMFRSWIHGFLPLVFAENCKKEQFPVAYGLFMMLSGLITFIMSLFVGFLRDYTQSFSVAFYFIIASSLVLIIPWTAEYYYTYRNKRKSTS